MLTSSRLSKRLKTQTRERFIPPDTWIKYMLFGSSHIQTKSWSNVRNSCKYDCMENCHFSTWHSLVSAKEMYITRPSINGTAKTIQAENIQTFFFFDKRTPNDKLKQNQMLFLCECTNFLNVFMLSLWFNFTTLTKNISRGNKTRNETTGIRSKREGHDALKAQQPESVW